MPKRTPERPPSGQPEERKPTAQDKSDGLLYKDIAVGDVAKAAGKRVVRGAKEVARLGGKAAKAVQDAHLGEKAAKAASAAHRVNRPLYGAEGTGLAVGAIVSGGVEEVRAHSRQHILEEAGEEVERRESADIAENAPEFQEQIDEKSTRELKNEYRIAKDRYATLPVEGHEELTRFVFAQRIIGESDLPAYLKETLPYVPFQESKYRTDLVSRTGARGAWQFMSDTARHNGLRVSRPRVDERLDFELATRAAVRYYTNIYDTLSQDEHYRTIEKKYALSPEALIGPATINAYQCGEGHFKKMFKILANSSEYGLSERDIEQVAEAGTGGLYTYITTRYRREYVRWQKEFRSGRKYGRESGGYVFSIEAFKQFDSGVRIEDDDGAVQGQSLVGLAASAAVAAAVYGALKRNDLMSRRTFLRASGKTAVAGLAGAVGGLFESKAGLIKHLFELMERQNQGEEGVSEPMADEDDRAVHAAEDIGRLAQELEKLHATEVGRVAERARSNDISRHGWKGEYIHNNYPKNQWMGDAAYVLYQETNEPVYLRLAEFYYRSARFLAQAQQEGRRGFALPSEGMGRVEIRLSYCDDALSVIEEVSRERTE
ncbi:hypothetical protein A3C17_00905 [Candidatus Uhrbacteria bacterium RIFCSPHIGHO2_02_FULL_53_13]|uniref:Transglycosylase SLT domain-containing protein n=1 Tax=Candidatus Uhrbacteria bacterium RIFCSPHIGHO2_02_FULL_53_13 TaxID=1802389 RepID=A0A1F7U146_9BACT|nr:MAG: hypothetical protein A3C17_00905 [Candidatus Uhrbacteria bacterium RIFCSPHIGHO2_02_FULL_53_13]